MLHRLIAQAQQTQDDFTKTFGTVQAPAGVNEFNAQTGVSNGIGIIIFVSTVIKLMTIVAGLWVLFNFISAGFDYVSSSGDTAANNRVRDKITMSVLGLVIIVASYTIIAILSLLIFGKADYILNPGAYITGPTGSPAY